MNIIIEANTYYQLIMAIQLNCTIFQDDHVTLLLSNHSNNAEEIYKRLREEKFFSKIFFIKSKGVRKQRSISQRLGDLFDISFRKDNRFSDYIPEVERKSLEPYDELICFNVTMDIYGIFYYLQQFNRNLRFSMYEESVLSYIDLPKPSKGQSFVNLLKSIQGMKTIIERAENFYCLYPNLYRGILNTITIPKIVPEGKCAETLRAIFKIEDVQEAYSEKYIFFTSVYDFEGGSPIGEYELVCKIGEAVGKENLLIKTHPRDSRNVFASSGLKTDKNASIPWETIQLSGDFSNKIFLTATSSSVLAGSFMAEKPSQTYYMFRLCNIAGNISAQKSASDIKELISNPELKDILSKVSIAEKIEDIIQ